MRIVIFPLALLLASVAQASIYECDLTNERANGPAVDVTYSLNTQTEENKFVELQDGNSAGCVVFRSKPELLACGLGNNGKFSMLVTAENGAAILALDLLNAAGKTSLKCVRRD